MAPIGGSGFLPEGRRISSFRFLNRWDGMFPQLAATSDAEQQTVFGPREAPEGLRRPQRGHDDDVITTLL